MGDDTSDIGDITDALDEVTSEFSLMSQYDLRMADERELINEIVGPIFAFYRAAEELNHGTTNHIYSESERSELESQAYKVGIAWPEAYQAYQTLQEEVDPDVLELKQRKSAMASVVMDEEKRESAQSDTAPGINSSRKEDPIDRVFSTIEELQELETKYNEGYAHAKTASRYMKPRDMTHPVEIAAEASEDEEVEQYFRELDAELPATIEEDHRQFMEMVEEAEE